MAVPDTVHGETDQPGKCSILFNEKGQPNILEQVKQILSIERSTFEPKYLGLPTPSGRLKGARFQSLKERLGKRLKDYTEKNMSAAAKEI
jgi:hypothetical protein